MMLEIYLEQRCVPRLRRHPIGIEDFWDNIDTISIKEVEPCCPFCGKILKAARCNCEDFEKALKKFLQTYEEKNLHIRYSCFGALQCYPLKKNNIKIVETKENGNSLFSSKHSKIQTIGSLYYAISLGKIEDGVLKFSLQLKGTNVIYECSINISVFSYPKLGDIIIFHYIHKTITYWSLKVLYGSYRIDVVEENVDKIPYGDFLKKLCE